MNYRNSVTKLALLVFTPAFVVFLTGLYLGTQFLQLKFDAMEAARINEVRTQSRIISDVVWSSVANLKTRVIAVRNILATASQLTPASSILDSDILYWSELEVKDAKVIGLKNSVKNALFKTENFEEQYLKPALARINFDDLRKSGTVMLQLADTDSLAFVFPTAETLVLAVVDPNNVFSSLKSAIAGADDVEGQYRVYLVSSSGHVLMHSQRNYIGADFSGTPLFKEILAPLAAGKQTNGAGTFRSIDQSSVAAAFVRIGTLPLAIVVEKLTEVDSFWDAALESGTIHRFIGKILVVGAFLLTVIFGFFMLFRRRLGISRVEASKANEEVNVSPQLTYPSPDYLVDQRRDPIQIIAERAIQEKAEASEASLRIELNSAHAALKRAAEESAIVSDYERDAAAIKDPASISYKLTKTATQLCESPTLYFTYHDSMRLAVLHSDAGFQGESPDGMSFPLGQEIMDRVIQADRNGEIASLADYGPLTKLVLARTGVAHFEAWALTGYGHLGRLSARPRLLGVLVILQAGVDSIARRESIARMIRTTGLAYENALLAQ